MRFVLLIAVLSGCSDDPTDPHQLGACDDGWQRNGYTECEAACRNSTVALTASGPGCAARTTAGQLTCSKTFEFEGAVGCCASVAPQVLFGECE
ncbi:MAG: hypothetical protein SFX73_39785 [Kofleriaceae bacterium]|nr:hypothetical protein [Kofleriaceae bacterium]